MEVVVFEKFYTLSSFFIPTVGKATYNHRPVLRLCIGYVLEGEFRREVVLLQPLLDLFPKRIKDTIRKVVSS